MKFINYLESIAGVGVYPLISLMIFFLFFVGVTWFVFRGKKEYFDNAANLPLNEKD
ncbi:MAG: cbb3-type cytochrome oxidase subunit 3 [Bacteroidia bacterium]|jgi:cbb3-type cytochrome oxidase subunit 3